MCYYNTREREDPPKLKGEKNMYYADYWEAHEAEWEAAIELEAQLLMDADYEASGGHLWD